MVSTWKRRRRGAAAPLATVGPVQPRVFAIAVVAAVLGAAGALALGALTGLPTAGRPPSSSSARSPRELRPPSLPAIWNGFNPAAIYARRSPGVVTIYADLGVEGQSQGSGFIVDGKGTILTNAHVVTDVAEASGGTVSGAETLYVEFKDRDRVPAKILGWDLFSDVAVIRVDPALHAVEPVPLGRRDGRGRHAGRCDREPVQRAELAVGRRRLGDQPHDRLTDVGLQHLRRDPDRRTDHHGNSGGPLFDARGA